MYKKETREAHEQKKQKKNKNKIQKNCFSVVTVCVHRQEIILSFTEYKVYPPSWCIKQSSCLLLLLAVAIKYQNAIMYSTHNMYPSLELQESFLKNI